MTTGEAVLHRPSHDPVKAVRSPVVTPTVLRADEPCWWLFETDLPSKNGKGKSRYQLVRVRRDDRLVTAYVHLGASSRFKADPFLMAGEGIHTVGELQDGAEELRSRTPQRNLEPRDLGRMFREYSDEKQRRRRKASTFGAGVALQRD